MKVDAVSAAPAAAAQSTSSFSNAEKRDELAREIHLRKVSYPGMVRQGRLRSEQADRHLAIMHAIWNDYVAKADEDKKAAKQEPQKNDDQFDREAEHQRELDREKEREAMRSSQRVAANSQKQRDQLQPVRAGGGDGEVNIAPGGGEVPTQGKPSVG